MTQLRLVGDSGTSFLTSNGIQVAFAPRESPPFQVQVMVFEEDTNLVLTVDSVIQYQEEHPIRTMTAILEAEPHVSGSVVVNDKSWYAVVIDLELDPICRKKWCEEATQKVFHLAGEKRITSLALPLLGTRHGGMKTEAMKTYVTRQIKSLGPSSLKRVWCVTE